MNEKYDEDINENLWYQTLYTKYDELFSRITNERWMICVPKEGSWRQEALEDELFAQTYFESHIIKEIVVFKSDENEKELTEKTGKFITFNSKEVFVSGNTIRCGNKFEDFSNKPAIYKSENDEMNFHLEGFHSAEILFEETFFNHNDESFVVICISQPLEANLTISKTLDDSKTDRNSLLDNKFEINQSYKMIWKQCNNPTKVQNNIGDLICKFNNQFQIPQLQERQTRNENEIENYISTAANNLIDLLKNCFQVLNRDTKLKKILESDFQTIHSQLEEYVLDLTYNSLMADLNNFLSLNESLFNRITRRLSTIKPFHLEIKESFWGLIPQARREFSRINRFKSSINKLKCIDRTISSFTNFNGSSSDAPILSSDDLLPILIYLVIKCDLTNLLANIIYLKIHQQIDINSPDRLKFYLATLEAAVQHIKTGNIYIDPLQVSQNTDNKTENLQKLFELIRSGSPNQVEMFLRQNETIQVLQNHDKCHPLCECSKCFKFSIRKAESGHSQVVDASIRDEHGWTALHVAAYCGKHEVIDILVKHKADISITNYHGETPLHVAAQQGSQSVIFILLHFGASAVATDNNHNTPLHLAAINGHDGSVKAFLYFDPTSQIVKIDCQNDVGDTALHVASRCGYVGIVEVLIECGADVSLRNRRQLTALEVCRDGFVRFVLTSTQVSTRYEALKPIISSQNHQIKKNDVKTRKKLLSLPKSSKDSLNINKEVATLHQAVAANDIELVADLCGWDAPDRLNCHPLCQCTTCHPPSKTRSHLHANSVALDGQTPLQVAARMGHVEMTRFLMSHGARAEGRRRGLGSSNLTTFHLAAQYGHAKVLEVLLSSSMSCYVDIKDGDNNTPLMMCSRNGHLDCVKLLIDRGANIEMSNNKGDTALHEAVRWRNNLVARHLVTAGASVYCKNDQGLTSLDVAKDEELVEIIQFSLIQFKKSKNIEKNPKVFGDEEDEDDERDIFEDYYKSKSSLRSTKDPNDQDEDYFVLSSVKDVSLEESNERRKDYMSL